MIENFKKKVSENVVLVTILIFLLLMVSIEAFVIYKLNSKDEIVNKVDKTIALEEKEIKEDITDNTIKIDIKGAVKNPGVYEVNDNAIVNDCISIAGGLIKNAYTNNINLSKKVENEMVIYIFTKQEFNKLNIQENSANSICTTTTDEVNTCTNKGQSIIKTSPKEEKEVNPNNTQKDNYITNLININNATLDELMMLPGVGESKASAIISYRQDNGNFQSIEDIKNVSGIGDALFDKIKEYITV